MNDGAAVDVVEEPTRMCRNIESAIFEKIPCSVFQGLHIKYRVQVQTAGTIRCFTGARLTDN